MGAAIRLTGRPGRRLRIGKLLLRDRVACGVEADASQIGQGAPDSRRQVSLGIVAGEVCREVLMQHARPKMTATLVEALLKRRPVEAKPLDRFAKSCLSLPPNRSIPAGRGTNSTRTR